MNALEMYYSGDWMVTRFDGHTDLWNTKPPLMIWLQTVFMHILGPNEMAVRLPSALAAFSTCALILFFCWKYLRNFWLGFFSVMILATSTAYITVHCARTGDYDSMLIFFIVAYCLSFFNFLESGQNKWIYLTATAIILAVLTKGIAGVMFLPGLLILVFVQKKQKQVAKNKHLYFATAIALFFSVGWFILREIAEPGYLDAVWKNDMGGRYTEVIEHHEQPFAYYFFQLFDRNVFAWAWLSIAGFIAGFLHKNEKVRKFNLLLLISALSYLLFISLSATKTEWYSAPLFPFLAIAAGISFSALPSLFPELNEKRTGALLLFKIALLLFIFLPEYSELLKKTQISPGTQVARPAYFLPNYLRQLTDHNDTLDNPVILINHYAPDVLFYKRLMEKQSGQEIETKNADELAAGDNVTTQYNPEWEGLDKKYVYDHYYTAHDIFFFNVTAIKQP